MSETKEFVTVEYRTVKEFCNCCQRRLDIEVVSDIREFNISKDHLLSTENWHELLEFEDEFSIIVADHVNETIRFFSFEPYEDELRIDESQYEKVKQFILEIIKETKE